MRTRTPRYAAAAAALALTLAACGDDANDEAAEPVATAEDEMSEEMSEEMSDEIAEVGTIVDVAASTDGFTTLVAAVQAAGLVDTLSSEGPFTVFAPTDDAFAAALDALGLTADELLADTDTLTEILTYHVVAGKVMSTDVVKVDSAKTLQGTNVSVDASSGVKINNANVVKADIATSNGVIHVIDTVLLPAS